MSFHKSKDYSEFLKSQGYNVFYKNLNLSWSIGKIRWRPYGVGAGQIATNPGSLNKELLIVEKRNDGESFELHSTVEDKISYYEPMRNSCFSIAAFVCIGTIYRYYSVGKIDIYILLFGGFSLICIINEKFNIRFQIIKIVYLNKKIECKFGTNFALLNK